MIILGISGGIGHDPAACIVINGQIKAMAEEERFTRVKRAPGQMPVFSTLYCLLEAGIDLHDVDAVAIAWDPQLDPDYFGPRDVMRTLTEHKAFSGQTFPPIVPIDHHRAHAASSFFPSGLSEATVLVVDGQGERASTTIAHARGREIKVLRSWGIAESMGYFYGAVSSFIGLGAESPGKTMGLAPYGQPRYTFPQIRLTDDGYTMGIHAPVNTPSPQWRSDIYRQWLKIFSDLFGPKASQQLSFDLPRGALKQHVDLDQRLQDIAASAQHSVEQLLLHLTRLGVEATGCRDLVLAGGVALNCTANGMLARSGYIDNLYVVPAAHDAGGALGAALALAAQHHEPLCDRINHAYWGPAFDDRCIAAALQTAGLSATQHDHIGAAAVKLIRQGAILGWFQGRMEVGPRALGHRSILADPTKAEIRNRANDVKNRERWRPFAPSLLLEDAASVLEQPMPSPFMLKAFSVRPEVQPLLEGVTHVDGSTRPQTVTDTSGPEFCDLLHAMREEIGIAAVLNTSFNDNSEPIVCTPYDAIRTFVSTHLDALAIGRFLVVKPPFTRP